jgi:nucleoside-diphosphate-sugar epimerase
LSLDWFKTIRRARLHIVPGYRRRWYSLVHVTDLVAAILLVVEKGTRVDATDAESDSFRQGCYFVAYDRHPSYGELGTMVANSLDLRFVIKYPLPDWGVRVAGRVNNAIASLRGRPHIFSADKAREVTAGSWTCSPERIQTELGFAPQRTLAERLREAADWYVEHGWL